MAHNFGYNQEWTATHTAMLCQVAPYTGEPQHRYYPCQWVTGHTICGSLVQCGEFSDHLRSCHGVIGPEKAQLTCYWNGCFSSMKRESLMRHVNEKHIEVKFTCEVCAEQFTRNHTMKSHMRREHSN